MNYFYDGSVDRVVGRLAHDLMLQTPIDVGEWQSMPVAGSKAHMTRELLDVVVNLHVPTSVPEWITETQADMPWAEEHFLERVSGIAYNPPPSHVNWPHAVRSNDDHTNDEGQFDHTYPERFWPRYAGMDASNPLTKNGSGLRGIRFPYGDLGDVVQLLAEFPGTRQAYLPVWFPEDTGGHNRDDKRVPCTLGYHFMIRYGVLSCRYYIRSCDIRRHFHNDVYFAGRLMQWMSWCIHGEGGLKTVPGALRIYVSSLHSFQADDSVVRGMMD